MNIDTLDKLSREELYKLIEIHSKDWLALDGLWFQALEREYGMDAAMKADVEVWRRYTATEARRIKGFLNLPENGGIPALAAALKIRLYANINRDEIIIKDNVLIYRTLECRVQEARERKGMDYHPCKSVGIVEYGEFAKVIDSRFMCRCISCYPEITDDTCRCAWEFSLED